MFSLVRPPDDVLDDLVREQAERALSYREAGGFATGAGRVIYMTDRPEEFGFAYGTLPAHPEQGEEAFHVARDGGRLVFTVTAFSRPRHLAARLGGPLTRAMQLRATRSYLRAMRGVAG